MYPIKVNGKIFKWDSSSISYSDVVKMSTLKPKAKKPLVVTYKNGVHVEAGEIHENCSALIRPKMLFFVK